MVKQSIQFSLLSKPSNIQYEFWIMMSEDCIFAIKETPETLDITLFVKFLEEVVAYVPDKVIIWLDNS